MVDQSDLPFRLQCRRYNVNLCYTPMIHAQLFLKSPRYRAAFGIHPNTDAMDRPLVAQICGGTSIDAVVQTALALAPHVDAIDINCGCPQFIAKRGHYGAFLLEDEGFLLPLIHALVAVLPIPLTVKVRLLPNHMDTATATTTSDTEANPPPPPHDLAASLRLYERLIDAGVHGLGVHGRTRHQKGPSTGPADVEALRQVVSAFSSSSSSSSQIPILVNGNVASRADAERLLDYTGAAGVLSAEALLEYPALFSDGVPPPPSRKELALEYMQLARDYPPDRCGQGSPALKIAKMHVHRLGHMYLGGDARRQQLIDAETMAQVAAVVESWPDTDAVPGALSWYYRHRGGNDASTQGGATVLQERQARERTVAPSDLLEDAGDCFAQLFLPSEDDDE